MFSNVLQGEGQEKDDEEKAQIKKRLTSKKAEVCIVPHQKVLFKPSFLLIFTA